MQNIQKVFGSRPISLLLAITLGFNLVLAPLQTRPAMAEDNAIPVAQNPQEEPADVRIAKTFKQSFREEFAQVIQEAEAFLKKTSGACKCKHKRQAVVLDLDETLMDNRAYFIIHKIYDPTLWDQWVEEGEAPAIPEALAFYQWLKAQGYRIYFISGRKEKLRKMTADNLSRMGVKNYDGLYLKPDTFSGASASDFKIAARKEIEAKGHKIILTIGDQQSDLKGGYGTGFKLPNPIYTVP